MTGYAGRDTGALGRVNEEFLSHDGVAETARGADVGAIGLQDEAGQAFRFAKSLLAQSPARRLDRIGDSLRSRQLENAKRQRCGGHRAWRPQRSLEPLLEAEFEHAAERISVRVVVVVLARDVRRILVEHVLHTGRNRRIPGRLPAHD